MLVPDARLYLPISESTLQYVLDDTKSMESVLQNLSLPEIATLFLLEYLSKHKANRVASLERILAEFIKSCNLIVENDGLLDLNSYALSVLNRLEINNGFQLLQSFNIALLDQQTIERGEYISSDGNWDYTFQRKYHAMHTDLLVKLEVNPGKFINLTSEQSRIYREFKVQSDEHIHIQGYAGTGKSSLIRSLVSMLVPTGAEILVLANYQRQLDATLIDVKQMRHVHKHTFSALASKIIPQDLTSSVYKNMHQIDRSRATVTDEALIRYLGIHASENFSEYQIIRAVRGTVFSFCHSDDSDLDESHIPHRYNSVFDRTTKNVICHFATELWKAIVSRPSKDFKPQIRGYHVVKCVALNRWPIPDFYTHVLVDECHDLPKSVQQILACSPQAVSRLGDDYQNLKGNLLQQPTSIRRREMTHSVRTGHEVETLINPIIAIHPSRTKAPFHGNRMNKIEIIYYDSAKVPEWPSVILVNDTWGLFEWAQRVATRNIDLELMIDKETLNMFVQDCIDLHSCDARARHPELFRFRSWAEVSNHNHNNPGFQRIDRLLEKGYAYKDWLQTFERFVKRNSRTHSLGLIENVLNHEFDNVMLTPDIFWGSRSRQLASFSSTIYVGITRAKRRLIVPQRLRNWIEEISAKTY